MFFIVLIPIHLTKKQEYIFYIIVNFPDGTDILLYSIFTMSLDFLKIHKKQKTEKQKFTIKENVMSEQVKMPVRHFLRSDYLHIFFYSKFLLFVCFRLFLSVFVCFRLFSSIFLAYEYF